MKNQKPVCFLVALFFTIHHGVAMTEDEVNINLADDIEMPDTLLQTTDPEKQKNRYREEEIVISEDGAKDSAIVKPDPLEADFDDKEKKSDTSKDIELKSEGVTKENKSIEHPDRLLKTTKDKSDIQNNNNKQSPYDDLEIPDPLLDNIN
ncbi:MAG: hypothetical protein L3K24_02445 [Gammaproteobacteria bacterium]|nr:hypothetical protein [Gammaproteobacteria bacterium]